jgi:hypothetical protein
VDGQVLRGFDFDPEHPYAAGQHRGIDIAAPVGAAVRTPAEGVVSFAGTVPAFGKTVSIQTPAGKTVTLLHLGSIAVVRGALAREGSTVATVGPSDDPTLPEPHVSMGIRTTADPQGYLDPLAFLPVRVSPVPPAAESPPRVVAATPTEAPAADPPAVEPPGASSAAAAAPTPAGVEAADAAMAAEPDVAPQPVVQQRADPAAESPRTVERRATATRASAGDSLPEAPATRPTAAPAVAAPATPPAQPAPATEPVVDAPVIAGSQDRRPAMQHRSASLGDRWARGRGEARTPSVNARGGHLPVWPVALVAAILLLGAITWRRWVGPKAARMMQDPQPEPVLAPISLEERPRRTGLAICLGSAPPRSRGGLRGARGHLRALPPPEGEPGPDGQWNGRARHAGDGHGRSRGRLAA